MVPFKTKKAPKRGNFHSPMWRYLICTIYYIFAPTKHLENFITIVRFVFTRVTLSNKQGFYYISDSSVGSWMAYGINCLWFEFSGSHFILHWCSSPKKIFHRDSSSSCQESWNPIHNWWYQSCLWWLWNGLSKKWIAQWLDDYFAMLKVYGFGPRVGPSGHGWWFYC